MRVADNSGFAENIPEDKICGFASDSGKPEQLFHSVWDFAIILVQQHYRASLNVPGLGAKQPAGFYGFRNFVFRRGGEAFECGELPEKRFRYHVHPHVRTLR